MAKKNAMDRLAKKQEQLDDLLTKKKDTEKRIEKIRKEMSEINNAQNKKWTDALQAALNKNGGSIDLARIPVDDVLTWLQSRSSELPPLPSQEVSAEESSGGTSEENPSTEDMETTPQENAYESENTMQ